MQELESVRAQMSDFQVIQKRIIIGVNDLDRFANNENLMHEREI